MPATVAVNSSCLVLSDPDFRGQDDCVPFLVTHQAQPLVSDRPRIPANPGDPEEFRGTVPLRTCALTKTYEARVFIDGSFRSSQLVPPTGREIRSVDVLIEVGKPRLADGCHFVEVYVSSQFSPSFTDFRRPARDGDLTFLLWTFINSPDATVASCGGGS